MKKLLLTTIAALVCIGAFGQGKLAFDINSDNLMYFTTDTYYILPADRTKTTSGTGTTFPIEGSGFYTGAGSTIAALTGSPSFTVSLFGGLTSSSLVLVTTGAIGDANTEGGLLNSVNITFSTSAGAPFNAPAGSPIFLQVQVYDSRFADTWSAWGNGYYAGESPIFTAKPQAGSYGPIYNTTASTVASTWAPSTGPAVTDMVQYGAGDIGGIAVYVPLPEPGTFTLVGLGAAVLMIFRRRK